MAKNTKSGLGRGLNSLLGSSYEEAIPAEPVSTPARPRVVVEDEQAMVESVTAAVIHERPARENVSRETFVEISTEKKIEQAKEEVSQNIVSDNVQIKGIVERKLDEVPIDNISPNPDQPRTFFKEEEIEELSMSIEKDGLLQPILVRATGKNTYQIIAGERRWQACKKAGLKTVPVRIKDANDDQALELALIENIQRSDLNPIEEAYGYRRLMDRCKMTQAEVAQAMSKGRSTVANALRLLELPEAAQQLLFEEKITAGHARAILSIPSKEGREKLTEKLMNEKLSVREAEAIARLLSGKATSSTTAPRVPLPQVYKKVAKALRDTLETNVRVKSSKGKNKIEIEFRDEEELKRLFERISFSSEAE